MGRWGIRNDTSLGHIHPSFGQADGEVLAKFYKCFLLLCNLMSSALSCCHVICRFETLGVRGLLKIYICIGEGVSAREIL